MITNLGDFHHLSELFQIARDQIEERELVEILSSLIAHLDDLMIALHQRRLGQLLPALFVVERTSRLQRDLDIATLECQAKASLLVFDKMKRYFRIAFLLQIRYYTLTDENRVAHHVEDLVVFAIDQRQLELVLGRVYGHDTRTHLSVQTVDCLARDFGYVDWQIKRSNDTMITLKNRDKK